MKLKDFWFIMRSAFIAGLCIGIAGFGYLAEKNIIGATLFSFGLLAVVGYGLKLYTGTAGFFKKGEFHQVLLILCGNIIGCGAMSLILRCSPMPLQETAQAILEGRLALGPLRGGILAIGCGFIMTTAVTFARQGKPLVLLFGVPLFINYGFPHCLADAFYYMAVPGSYTVEHIVDILMLYPCLVIGNFIGCNLYRFVMPEQQN
jgi:formate/nitrite transporter FocA (FNT family)